jgi:hypothetical protein
MFKFFLALVFGVAVGYGYGWKDAQAHEKNVAERLVEHIGGVSRGMVGNDIDTRYGTGDSK